MTVFDIVLIIVTILCLIIGIIGCIVPGLPGTPLCWGGLLASSFVSTNSLTWVVLVITAVVAVATELITSFVPAYFTKQAKGSKAGQWGSTIGVFIGLLSGQWWGILLGPFLGAFVGELIHDNSDTKRAFKSAGISFLGFLTGIGLKLIVSAIFILICVHSYIK